MGQRLDGDQGLSHSVSTFLHRRPRLQLALLLSGPVGWLVVAYLGSLAVLLAAAFWQLDTFTSAIVKDYSLQNFETLVTNDVYRQIALRTVGIAAAVTVTDALLAFALSFDEVIVTTFTAGAQQTLPIWILTNLSRPNQLPIVNVVGVAVIVLSLIPVYVAQRLTRDPVTASAH